MLLTCASPGATSCATTDDRKSGVDPSWFSASPMQAWTFNSGYPAAMACKTTHAEHVTVLVVDLQATRIGGTTIGKVYATLTYGTPNAPGTVIETSALAGDAIPTSAPSSVSFAFVTKTQIPSGTQIFFRMSTDSTMFD